MRQCDACLSADRECGSVMECNNVGDQLKDQLIKDHKFKSKRRQMTPFAFIIMLF